MSFRAVARTDRDEIETLPPACNRRRSGIACWLQGAARSLAGCGPIRPGGGEYRRRAYPDHGLLVRFARFTGLRSAESVALRPESVDLLCGLVHVASSGDGGLRKAPVRPTQDQSPPSSPRAECSRRRADRFRVHAVKGWTAAAVELLRPTLQACRAPVPGFQSRRGSTTCDTATPPCSSPKAPIRGRSWNASVTARSRSPSEPTVMCSRAWRLR